MRQNTVKMTTAQFAELHGVNRRTLHYYDDIGLFSPCQKGENGYRYYDASQSIVFEYIRMLKELNMSIAEIADYCKHPAPEKFLQIADRKEAEIDLEIRRLKRARNILKTKKAQVRLCEGLPDEEIRVSPWTKSPPGPLKHTTGCLPIRPAAHPVRIRSSGRRGGIFAAIRRDLGTRRPPCTKK